MDWLGSEALSWLDLLDIVTQSGSDTAIYRSMNAHWPQTVEAELLRSMETSLRILVWQKTRDGSRGINQPRPMRWPWDEPEGQHIRGDAMSMDEALDWLGWTREMRDPNHDTHQAFPDDEGG